VITARDVQNAPGVPTPQAPGVPTPQAIEQEVLDNVKHQPVGDGTVDDLALPEAFLRRVADRVVRTSYEERYRIIVKDGTEAARGAPKVALAVGAALLVIVVWFVVARRGAKGPR
jgi:hypothetical protein